MWFFVYAMYLCHYSCHYSCNLILSVDDAVGELINRLDLVVVAFEPLPVQHCNMDLAMTINVWIATGFCTKRLQSS